MKTALKRAAFVAPAILGLAVAAAVWARPGRKAPPALQLAGTVEARDVEVGSLVGGRVTAVHVDEGALVTPGQPLLTLDPDLLDLQIGEQQAQRDQARARLALTLAGPRREELDRARVDWQNAEAERARFEALLADNAVARRDYDNAVAAARIKRATLDEMERGNRAEDIAAARAGVAAAESHLAFLERQREETVVTAPAAGVVQSFDLRPGALVTANQPVLNLLETDQLWVRVYVPETELGRVRVGQPAVITIDTFQGRSFAGSVVEIRPQGEYTPRNIQTLEQRSDLVFGVKVGIAPGAAKDLRPGMAALVRLAP
jgi:membrane fusion protein YbhG